MLTCLAQAELQMSASYTYAKDEGRPFYRVMYIIKVWNDSDESITIPTKYDGSNFADGELTISNGNMRVDDKALAYPVSMIDPVEIRKGEITFIKQESRTTKEPTGDIAVKIKISEDFSKRYGTWSGTIVGTAKKIEIPQKK